MGFFSPAPAKPVKKAAPAKTEPAKQSFEMPDFTKTSSSSEEKHEFTLEEIMKEYGHDF